MKAVDTYNLNAQSCCVVQPSVNQIGSYEKNTCYVLQTTFFRRAPFSLELRLSLFLGNPSSVGSSASRVVQPPLSPHRTL